MKASQQAIERGVKDCVFIDYKRRSGHFDVTTVASIKEITEKVFYSDFRIYSLRVFTLAVLYKDNMRFLHYFTHNLHNMIRFQEMCRNH